MIDRRFLLTVAVAALPPLAYAGTVLAYGGAHGPEWLKNDPAFSVFALCILPVLFGLFVTAIDWKAVRAWPDRRSLGVVFALLTACGLAVVAGDVPQRRVELDEPGAMTAPLLLREHEAALHMERALRSQLPLPRDVLIQGEDDAQKNAAAEAERRCRAARRAYVTRFPGWTSFEEFLSRAGLLAWLALLTNLVAALFCAWGLCYLFVVVRVRRAYRASSSESLIVVLSFALLWFPCRVYSDWYANFYAVRDTLVSYGAFWLMGAFAVIAILLLVVALSPERQLSRVVGTLSATLGAVMGIALAVKPNVAFHAAEAFERAAAPFVVVLAIVTVGALIVLIDATRATTTRPGALAAGRAPARARR